MTGKNVITTDKDKTEINLPLYVSGEVVHGFGRGSKQLGVPTANFPDSVIDNLPASLRPGVYCGWANVDNGPVHKMVLCVGWHPFYKNTKQSMETHILHQFSGDFYGSRLKVVICTFLREERDFPTLDALRTAINCDIDETRKVMDQSEFSSLQYSDFFTEK